MPKLKVYGWTGHRLAAGTYHNQTREIIAARSQAEAARLAGYRRPSAMWNLCETGNPPEIDEAMAHPGKVLWRPLDAKRIGVRKYVLPGGGESMDYSVFAWTVGE